jgi:hypothetical protein
VPKKKAENIQNPILLHGSTKAIQARLKNLRKHVTTQKKEYIEDVSDVVEPEDTDYYNLTEKRQLPVTYLRKTHCLDDVSILQIKRFGITSILSASIV